MGSDTHKGTRRGAARRGAKGWNSRDSIVGVSFANPPVRLGDSVDAVSLPPLGASPPHPRPQKVSAHPLARITRTAALLPLVWLACSQAPSSEELRIGATRTVILETHGSPQRKQLLSKSDEPIWGAIEEFWESVPVGSSIEIWAYPVEGGTLELYFVDHSEQVQGTGFAPTGAVFEGGS
jgi:hypothetical protein